MSHDGRWPFLTVVFSSLTSISFVRALYARFATAVCWVYIVCKNKTNMTALKLYLIRACNLLAEFISYRIQQQQEKCIPKSMWLESLCCCMLAAVVNGRQTICFELRMNLSSVKFKSHKIRNSCDRFGPWWTLGMLRSKRWAHCQQFTANRKSTFDSDPKWPGILLHVCLLIKNRFVIFPIFRN